MNTSGTPCDCDETVGFSTDAAGRKWVHCRACEHRWALLDHPQVCASAALLHYVRPNTGNHPDHPDHPPVEGGYRGDK